MMTYAELVTMLRERVKGDKKLYPQGAPFETLLLDLAADAIENLDDICQHQADEIRELKNQWIPVTERLPMRGEKAICFGKNGYMIGTYGEFGWMFPCYFGNVTHWMPLPKQPEDGAE